MPLQIEIPPTPNAASGTPVTTEGVQEPWTTGALKGSAMRGNFADETPKGPTWGAVTPSGLTNKRVSMNSVRFTQSSSETGESNERKPSRAPSLRSQRLLKHQNSKSTRTLSSAELPESPLRSSASFRSNASRSSFRSPSRSPSRRSFKLESGDGIGAYGRTSPVPGGRTPSGALLSVRSSRRLMWRMNREAKQSGDLTDRSMESEDEDEEDARRQKIWDPQARRKMVMHKWQRALFAVQISIKNGTTRADGSMALLSEVYDVVAGVKNGSPETVEHSLQMLARLATNKEMRNAIVASKGLPVITENAIDFSQPNLQMLAVKAIAEIAKSPDLRIEIVAGKKAIPAMIIILQCSGSLRLQELAATTLTSMASDEEGRAAVNAVKVPLFHVGLPTNRHLYANVAAQMSIMETAKGMGVEPNRVRALDVLFLVISKFSEETEPIVSNSQRDFTLSAIVNAIAELCNSLRLRTKMANAGMLSRLATLRCLALPGSMSVMSLRRTMNTFVNLRIPVDRSDGAPGVNELISEIKSPSSKFETKVAAANALSRCAISYTNCVTMKEENAPQALVSLMQDASENDQIDLLLQSILALEHLVSHRKEFQTLISQIPGASQSIASQLGRESSDVKCATANLISALAQDSSANQQFHSAGAVKMLSEMARNNAGEEHKAATRALCALLTREEGIESVLTDREKKISHIVVDTPKLTKLSEWQAYLSRPELTVDQRVASITINEATRAAMTALANARHGSKQLPMEMILLQMKMDPKASRGILSMDIIPMLVGIMRDGKRFEKALAADICTLLAKEQINRYALAEAPGLLLEAGKCLTVKDSTDQAIAENAANFLAYLTSTWGVRDLVREEGLLPMLVKAAHPLGGLNQRAKEAVIRALFGLCDTEAGAKEVAGMGAAIILHPLLNAAFQPLRNAAFQCLSRILIVPGYEHYFGEDLAGEDAADKVMTLLLSSNIQNQLTAARMINGLTQRVLVEVVEKGGVIPLLRLIQDPSGQSDGTSKASNVDSPRRGDVGRQMFTGVMKAVHSGDGPATAGSPASPSKTPSNMSSSQRRMNAISLRRMNKPGNQAGAHSKFPTTPQSPQPASGQQPPENKLSLAERGRLALKNAATVTCAAGALVHLLREVDKPSEHLVKRIENEADYGKLVHMVDPTFRTTQPEENDPLSESIVRILCIVSSDLGNCEEIQQINGTLRSLVAAIGWGYQVAKPAMICLYNIFATRAAAAGLQKAISSGIVQTLVEIVSNGINGQGIQELGTLAARILDQLMNFSPSVRVLAAESNLVDAAAIPLRQLEAGDVSTLGTIGVGAAVKLLGHMGCEAEPALAQVAEAAFGPLVRMVSKWSEDLDFFPPTPQNGENIGREPVEASEKQMLVRISTALLNAVPRNSQILGAFLTQRCLPPTIQLLASSRAHKSGALAYLQLQEAAARVVQCVLDDPTCVKDIIYYSGGPIASLLSSSECTRECIDITVRIVSSLIGNQAFLDSLQFPLVIGPLVRLVAMKQAREVSRVTAVETLTKLARQENYCHVILANLELIECLAVLLNEGIDAGRIAVCQFLVTALQDMRCAEPFARQLVDADYFEYLKPLLKKRRADLQEVATGVWQLMAMKSGASAMDNMADIMSDKGGKKGNIVTRTAVSTLAQMSVGMLRKRLMDNSNNKVISSLVMMLKTGDDENVSKALTAISPLLEVPGEGADRLAEAGTLPALYPLIEAGNKEAADFWEVICNMGSPNLVLHVMHMAINKDVSESGKAFALQTVSRLIERSDEARDALLSLEDGISTLVGISLHGADWKSDEMKEEEENMAGSGSGYEDDLPMSDIDSMVGDMPHSFVEARVAALETITAVATSPEEVLLITGKSRCLEAIRKSMFSASPEVAESATFCWSHLFTVGGVGVVAAAIELLCNDKSSLSDKDAAAVALASLAESDKPRAAILESQAALDGLAALLQRWDYDVEGGDAQGKANAALALRNIADSTIAVLHVAGTGALKSLLRIACFGPKDIRKACKDVFDSIVRNGAYAVIPHLLGFLSFEHEEPIRHAALQSLDTAFQNESLRNIMLSDGSGINMLVRLLPQDTRENKVAILMVLYTVTANSVKAAEQMVEAGIIQLLQPLVALAGGPVGRAATKLWDRLVDYAGPQVVPALAHMASEVPGSETAKITAARTLAFMASSEEHGSKNRMAILNSPDDGVLRGLVDMVNRWGESCQLQAFAAFCALARDGANAAGQLESKGAFAALQQAMRQTDGPCRKAATDAWMTLNVASGEAALPRVTQTLLEHEKEHDSLLGAAAGTLAKIIEENHASRKKLMQQSLSCVVEALLSLLDSRRSELTRSLGLQALLAITHGQASAAAVIQGGALSWLESFAACKFPPQDSSTKTPRKSEPSGMSKRLQSAIAGKTQHRTARDLEQGLDHCLKEYSSDSAVACLSKLCQVGGQEVKDAIKSEPGAANRITMLLNRGDITGRHMLLDAIHEMTEQRGRRARVQLTKSGIVVPLLRIMRSSDEDSHEVGLALSALLVDLPYEPDVHSQILDSISPSELVSIIGDAEGLMDGEPHCEVATLLLTYLAFTSADCEEIYQTNVVDPLIRVLDFAARGMFDESAFGTISGALGCLAQLCSHVPAGLDKVAQNAGVSLCTAILEQDTPAGGPAAGRLLGLLAGVPISRRDVMMHLSSLSQIASGKAGDEIAQESAAWALREIILSHTKTLENPHDLTSEFRDLARPLLAVLQDGNNAAKQAAADALAALALDKTGSDLIGALGGVKTLVPIITDQTGQTSEDDCKGAHIDAAAGALDALAGEPDQLIEMQNRGVFKEMLVVLARGNNPGRASAARCLRKLAKNDEKVLEELKKSDCRIGLRHIAVKGFYSQRQAGLDLMKLVDERAYQKLLQVEWANPMKQRRALIKKNIMSKVKMGLMMRAMRSSSSSAVGAAGKTENSGGQ